MPRHKPRQYQPQAVHLDARSTSSTTLPCFSNQSVIYRIVLIMFDGAAVVPCAA